MDKLFENSLYSFSIIRNERNILFFDWTHQTSEMNYEDFQEACNNFAGFAWQYGTLYLLVDTRKFSFRLPADFEQWREQELNPRYYSLGIRKFAYITTPEHITDRKDSPAQDGKFETRNFVTEQDALTWLNQH